MDGWMDGERNSMNKKKNHVSSCCLHADTCKLLFFSTYKLMQNKHNYITHKINSTEEELETDTSFTSRWATKLMVYAQYTYTQEYAIIYYASI